MTRSEVRVPHRPPLCGVFLCQKISPQATNGLGVFLLEGRGKAGDVIKERILDAALAPGFFCEDV